MAEIIRTETDEETGRQFHVYDDGTTKWADTGHWKTNNPRYALTSERAHELAHMSVLKRKIGKLRGRIKGAGLDIPEQADAELLANLDEDAATIYTAHLGKVFLESKNVRGMGEVFPKLMDETEAVRIAAPFIQANVDATAARQFLADVARVLVLGEDQAREVIEGKAKSVE